MYSRSWIGLHSCLRRCVISCASEIEDERSDLKRHLLVFSYPTYGLGLEQLQLIVPWFDLDTSAERQRSNDVSRLPCSRRLRGGFRRGDGPVCRNPIAEVRTDQVGDFLRAVLQRLEKELRVPGLILVGRLLQ